MLRLLTILLLAFAFIEAGAQKLWTAGYTGSYFTQPGLHLSYKTHLKANSPKKQKILSRGIYGGFQLGYFHHFNMQNGVYAAPELALLKENEHGLQIGYELGVGALITQPTNTYEWKNGSYEKAGFDPQFQMMLSPAFSIGKRVDWAIADAWHIKNRVMVMPFYTEQATFRYFFEIGVSKSLLPS